MVRGEDETHAHSFYCAAHNKGVGDRQMCGFGDNFDVVGSQEILVTVNMTNDFFQCTPLMG